MLKLFNKKKKDNKGFTLVELVIVVAILAILVGILAPQYTKYVEKSRQSADVSNLENIVKGFKVAAADTDYNIIPKGDTSVNYTITIDSTGTVVSTADSGDAWKKALKEYTGYDFSTKVTDLKLKSKKWSLERTSSSGTKTTDNAIEATVTVDSKGSVVVEYNPTSVRDIANNTNN